MSNEVPKESLISWIEEAIINEKFAEHEIKLLGKTEKGDGYIGEIVFAKVTGVTTEHKAKELNLVLKHGKSNTNMRETMPLRTSFETEIHLYSKIIPAFRKLQEEFHVQDVFDSVPKCYKTILLDNMEVLIMDNLKIKGFELHDRNEPLNLDHQKRVVIEYGKFNALSFALRYHRPTEFTELTNRPNAIKEFFNHISGRNNFTNAAKEVLEVLEEKKDFYFREKFKSVLPKDAGDIMFDFLHNDISETVITHGDCWNNNFMFNYKDNNRTSPAKIAILDWQLSSLRSPVFDLSHFIYATSSEEQLENVEKLLEVYYDSFSTFLRKLGCNPDELFPYSSLKTHWKIYSLYGFLYVPMITKFLLTDVEDTPDFGDLKEGESFADALNIGIKNRDLFYERIKIALQHFFSFEFKN